MYFFVDSLDEDSELCASFTFPSTNGSKDGVMDQDHLFGHLCSVPGSLQYGNTSIAFVQRSLSREHYCRQGPAFKIVERYKTCLKLPRVPCCDCFVFSF